MSSVRDYNNLVFCTTFEDAFPSMTPCDIVHTLPDVCNKDALGTDTPSTLVHLAGGLCKAYSRYHEQDIVLIVV